jgi:eukaryotic-like serine/threonine-protein kinase
MTPPSLIAHYKILSKLGEGGMGAVYRASDTRLNRDAAIKVLPDSFAGDPDRLARFTREAQSASALNHPNIITIYEIGESNRTLFIAMEYVDGKTLESLIQGRGLAIGEILKYAVQIADAFAKAHAAGIVHRDLKPGNVMVTTDGFVKVLDFGLAKLIETGPASSEGETVSMAGPQTMAGHVLGTPAFMSPEQAEGRPVDARSDIFSFGALLYQMVTGRYAFRQQSNAATLAAVLMRDPDPLPETVPASLQTVIWRCLRKDPARRFQNMADVRVVLQELRDELESRSGSMPRITATPVRSRRAILPWIAATAAAGTTVGAYFLGRAGAPRTGGRFQRITFRRGFVPAARFSPDGQTIVFSAAWGSDGVRLYSGRPDRPEYRALDLPQGYILAISSKSEMALLSGNRAHPPMERTGTLSVAPLAGGAARELIKEVQFADWSPDGSTLAVVRPQQRYRLEYPAGKLLYESEGGIADPRVSPDGSHVAYIDQPSRGDDAGFVALAGSDGKRRRLSPDWRSCQGLAWSPKADELVFSAATTTGGRQLYAVTLSGKVRTLATEADRLLLHDVSRTGQLLVSHEQYHLGIIVSAGGQPERDVSWLDAPIVNDISEDGGIVVFAEGGAGVNGSALCFLRRLSEQQPVQLGPGRFPVLSPNGQWVAAISTEMNQIVLLPTGAGESRTLPPGPLSAISNADWIPDSRHLLITGSEKGKSRRDYVQDIEDGPPRPIFEEDVATASRAFTPDGRRFVGKSKGKTMLIPWQGGEAQLVTGLPAGYEIVAFDRDGVHAYVQNLDSLPTEIDRFEIATGKRTPWKKLAPRDLAGVTGLGPVLLTKDLKSYAYNYESIVSELYAVQDVL